MKTKTLAILILLIVLLTFVLTACGEEVIPTATTDPVAATIDPDYTPTQVGTVTPTPKPVAPQPTHNEEEEPMPWVPYIFDTQPEKTIGNPDYDDSVQYTYAPGGFVAKNGVLSSSGSTYISGEANTLAVNGDTPFPYGTISCSVTSNNTSDTGIVFRVTGNGDKYWEGAGISYYFYFISRDGSAYLGKADNGAWAALAVISSGLKVQAGTQYHLKVIVKDNVIICYLNNKLMLTYRDMHLLPGTAYGIRSGMNGATFGDFAITNEYLYQ